MDNIIEDERGRSLVRVYVCPSASKTKLCGLYGEPARIKLQIKSPPTDGKANKEVITYFSSLLKINKSAVEIIRGHKSRQKDLLIDFPPDELKSLMKALFSLDNKRI